MFRLNDDSHSKADILRCWKSFELHQDSKNYDDNRHSSMKLSEKELVQMKRLRNTQGNLSVSELEAGDIVLVQGTNIVNLSQTLTHTFSRPITRMGRSNTVHCMLVTQVDQLFSKVAHITRLGAEISILEDPVNPEAFIKEGFDPPTRDPLKIVQGTVFRLESNPRLSLMASNIALELVNDYQVHYNFPKSFRSVFRNPRIGRFLSSKRTPIFKPRSSKRGFSMSLFCSEFIIKCYQESFSHLDPSDIGPDTFRTMDLHGSACSPCCLEGFLRSNSILCGDWREVGHLDSDILPS